MKKLALVLLLVLCPIAFAQDAGAAVVAADAGAMLTTGNEGPTISVPPLDAKPKIAESPKGDVIADPIAFVKAVRELAMTKDWGNLMFVIITAIVVLLRKFGPGLLQTKIGGALAPFALAFTGMLATSWPAGTKLEISSVLTAFNYGFAAAGMWSVLKNTLEHAFEKWKWGWAKSLLDMLAGPKPAPAPA